jgi:hypothetical protein
MRFAYYQKLNARQKSIYRESDHVEQVKLRSTSDFETLIDALTRSLEAESQPNTQRAAQSLLSHLTESLGVSPLKVKVLRRRPSWDTGELHGLYEPGANGVNRVSVWMRTAQRAQVVKFKTFLRTLLHELCHHLDYEQLGLQESFHTEGFYKRESSLLRQLYAAQPNGNRRSTPKRGAVDS